MYIQKVLFSERRIDVDEWCGTIGDEIREKHLKVTDNVFRWAKGNIVIVSRSCAECGERDESIEQKYTKYASHTRSTLHPQIQIEQIPHRYHTCM